MVQDIEVVLEGPGWEKVKFVRGVYSGTHSQPWMGMKGRAVCAIMRVGRAERSMRSSMVGVEML
jgi:hypothetical protein